MNLTDYYEKTAKFGLALKPAAYAGGVGAIVGATKGAFSKQDKKRNALREGLASGILLGMGSGLIVGQGVKHGKRLLEYLERTTKVI